MWWHHDGGWWGWFGMGLSMVVFWGLVIAAIVWAVRATRGDSGSITPQRSARDILDERFARGEISEDEYRRSRDALSER